MKTENEVHLKRCVKGSSLLLGGLVYLLLPNVLFLLGWVRAVWAIPLSVLLSLSLVYLWRDSRRNTHANICLPITKSHVISLSLLLILALLLTEIISFHGHSLQHDDFVARNSIYNKLIDETWPTHSSQGDYFVYNHSFWLFPAFVSKLIGKEFALSLLFVWSWMGISLTFIYLYIRLKKWTFLFVAILCFHESLPFIYDNSIVFARKACLIAYLPSPVCDVLKNWSHLQPIQPIHLNYCLHQLCNTFNHSIPGGVFISLILSRLLPVKYYLVPAAMICSLSPMLAVAVAPFLFVVLCKLYISRKQLPINAPSFIFSFLVALVGIYLSTGGHSGSSDVRTTFTWCIDTLNGRPGIFAGYFHTWTAMISFLCVVVPLCLLTSKKIRRNSYFICCVMGTSIICFAWVGRWNNELLFKGSLLIAFLQALILTTQWKYSSHMHRIWIALVIFVPHFPLMLVYLGRSAYTYSWEKERIAQNMRIEDVSVAGHRHYANFYHAAEPNPLLFYGSEETSPLMRFTK